MRIIFEPETSEEKILAAKYTFNKVPKKGYQALLDLLETFISPEVEKEGKCKMCKWDDVNKGCRDRYPCTICIERSVYDADKKYPYFERKDGRDPWCSLCANGSNGECCSKCITNSTFYDRRPEFLPIFVVKEDWQNV